MTVIVRVFKCFGILVDSSQTVKRTHMERITKRRKDTKVWRVRE